MRRQGRRNTASLQFSVNFSCDLGTAPKAKIFFVVVVFSFCFIFSFFLIDKPGS